MVFFLAASLPEVLFMFESLQDERCMPHSFLLNTILDRTYPSLTAVIAP